GSSQQSSVVTIENTPPTASDLSITPSDAKTGDTLTAVYTFTDIDGDSESGTERIWYKDGVLQGALNDSSTVGSSYTSKSEEWHFKVRPSDGIDFGNWISCPLNITIGNTAPTATNLAITPSIPKTGDDLTASYTFSDMDGDSESGTKIIWYKDGVLQGALNDSTTVGSSSISKGEEWHFKVQPYDSADYGIWTSCPTNITVSNTAPTATNLAITPSDARTDDDLTANYDFNDADGDSESGSLIQWFKNGVPQGTYENQTLVPSSATAKGENWYFTIQPSDGTDYGTPQQSDVLLISNTAPSVNSLQITPSDAKTGDTLTADYTFTDIDGDSESGTERIWYKDGVLQGALNDSLTVDSSYTSKGEEWHFKIRPSDGTDFGTWASCPLNVTIGNTAPTTSNLQISPSDAKTNNNLTASYSYSDADGDSESGSEIIWYKDGILQGSLNGSSMIGSSLTAKDEEWHFKVRPSDSEEYGIWYSCPLNVTILNSPPVVSDIKINGFSSPVQVTTDTSLTVDYTYFDADGDSQVNSSREILWYNNSVLIGSLNNSLVVGSGNTSNGDIWYYIIRVYDGTDYSTLGNSPSATIEQAPNNPPTATDLNITPMLPITSDSLYINYTYSDPESDDESGTMIYWYRNGEHLSAYDGLKTLPNSATIKGEEWHVKVRPRDGTDFGNWVSVPINVTIGNTAPYANSLEILPSNPKTGNDLVVSYTFTDVDPSDSESGSKIIWYKDGVLQDSLNDSVSVASSNTLKGEVWHFKVQPSDGTDYGVWNDCPTNITIGNTMPSASNPQVTPTGAKTGDVLTATYTFSDIDGDSESGSEIRWYKDGELQGALNDSSTVDSSYTSKGQIWYFTIRPFDGIDLGIERNSPGITILNTAPTASNLEITPASSTTLESLNSNYDFNDTDGDSESGTEIRWYKDGVLQGALNDSSAVNPSYTSKGEEWYFKVLPKDGTNFGIWVSCSVNITIINTAPSASNLYISPSDAKTNDDISINYDYSDVDNDVEGGTEIIWYKDGALQGAFNDSSSINSLNTVRGDEWHFKVRPNDGSAFGVWVGCPINLTIGNTIPSASNLQVTPTSAKTSNDLTATYTYSDADSDAETISYIIWYKDGVPQGVYENQSTIPSATTSKGQIWYFTIQPNDGTDLGIERISAAITILNTAPTASDLQILPGVVNTGDTLIVDYNYSDVDGDLQSGSQILWYIDGILQVTLNDSTQVDSTYTSRGDVWHFKVQPKDGTDLGVRIGCPINVTITNTAPSTSNLLISPSDAKTGDDLVISYTYLDADNDLEDSTEIIWYKDGVLQGSLNGSSTVDSSNTITGEEWHAKVRPYDGTDYGLWNSCPINVTIGNTAPTASTLQLSPTIPKTEDDLTATYVYFDLDGDPQSGSLIQWYLNGIEQVLYENQTIVPSSATLKGQNWYFSVQPFDGIEFGSTKTSVTVTIGNTAPTATNIQFSPASPTASSNLDVSYSFTDLDSDSQTGTQIRWYKNNIVQPTYNDLTQVLASELSKGDLWNVSIRVSDGTDYSEWNNASVNIQNSAPIVIEFSANIYVSPSGLFTSDSLIANWDVADADGDSIVDIYIRWYQNLIPITKLENVTEVASNYTIKNDEWRFRVQVFDGEDWSPWSSDAIQTIANSEPLIENITLSGGISTTNDIHLTYDYYDADNDSDFSTIQWKIVHLGSVNTVAGSTTLSNSEFTAGDLVWVVITPDDNEDTGPPVDSSTLSGSHVMKLVGDTA
ncbi:MAG: hypothetical protein ACW99R_16910, partial [Candidatus Hodarchaeales archaeon]